MASRSNGSRHADADIRRLALGCLLAGWTGAEIPDWIAGALPGGLGGVVLFGSNLGDGRGVRDLTDHLRELAARDLTIAVDEEGGDVTRLDTLSGSVVPGAAALGALDDPRTTEEVYAAIGDRLAGVGVTVDLAPVADVNNNPSNPVIGVRSFGADPDLVGRHVAAAVTGLQRSGVAACVKHFPGHGDTATDSHRGVAVIAADRDRLERLELAPFRRAIEAGTRSIMTGHLLVPALDSERLATVSPFVNSSLLRDQLGFAGTIVTDALEMRALADTLGMAEGFVQALIAGADAIELGAQDHPRSLVDIPDAALRAVRNGRLSYERLVDAASRTAALAEPGRPTGYDRATVRSAAARSLSVSGRVPVLQDPQDAFLVECRTPNGEATGTLPWSLADRCAEAGRPVDSVTVGDSADAAAAVQRIRRGSATVVLVVRDVHRFAWQHQLVRAVAALGPDRGVVVDAGWPSVAAIVDDVPIVETRGIAPVLLAAVAELLIHPVHPAMRVDGGVLR
jgi:beta-N-acetylhexosaminidase